MNDIFDESILDYIQCPKTGDKLFYDKKTNTLFTLNKKHCYKIDNGIPLLLTDEQNTDT